MAKKHICGEPDISRETVHDLLTDYYFAIDEDEYCWGPPVDAMNTAEFELTGRYRWAGNAVKPRMEIEMVLTWQETPRKIKWFCWPPMKVIKLEPVEYETVVWVKESSILFNVEQDKYTFDCERFNGTA